MRKVIGVGAPIVDLLARVPEAFLAGVPGEKGGMLMVSPDEQRALVESLPEPPARAPGGAAANTISALAKLGLPVAFVGKLGGDADGDYYLDAFAACGGDTSRFKRAPESHTARCLSMITPDAARTMRTDLGASLLLRPEELGPADFAGCTHAFIEGYLLFNPPLAEAALRAAKEAGCTVSLDMGSFEIVRAFRDTLPGLLDRYVDAVFANEDEAREFIGRDDPAAALDAFSAHCGTVAVKLGAEGAWVRDRGETVRVAPEPVDRAVDSTGAGDCWAAGFLYGWLQGWPAARCGGLASLLGAETVKCLGAQPDADGWARIHARIGLS